MEMMMQRQVRGVFVVAVAVLAAAILISCSGEAAVVNTAEPTAEPTQEDRVKAAVEAAGIDVVNVISNALSMRFQVVFVVDNSRADVVEKLERVFCAAKDLVYDGYGLRMAGQLSNDMTMATVTVPAESLDADCVSGIDLEALASEYSIASGLQ